VTGVQTCALPISEGYGLYFGTKHQMAATPRAVTWPPFRLVLD